MLLVEIPVSAGLTAASVGPATTGFGFLRIKSDVVICGVCSEDIEMILDTKQMHV